jgi:hypothetical protein
MKALALFPSDNLNVQSRKTAVRLAKKTSAADQFLPIFAWRANVCSHHKAPFDACHSSGTAQS